MDCDDDVKRKIGRSIAESIAKRIAIGIALFFAFLLFILLGGIVVQWLWNWLMPDLFSLRRITWMEALGLLALSRILFGGFGRGGGSHRPSRKNKVLWKKANGEWIKSDGDTTSTTQPAAGES